MPVVQSQTWAKAQQLLVGAVLAPGKRTVTSALRVLGQEAGFAKYHHVLNRSRWSPLTLSKVLLFLLLRHLDTGRGPLLFGIDETPSAALRAASGTPWESAHQRPGHLPGCRTLQR